MSLVDNNIMSLVQTREKQPLEDVDVDVRNFTPDVSHHGPVLETNGHVLLYSCLQFQNIVELCH